MHGHSPESVLLVNAEVDSMGGVIHGGVGIDNKTSPRQAAIEKAQAELRQEFDVREERRRELEFLEKGGNPLDFKIGAATSISVQSTSVTDQFVTSEAKGSFALTASPRGDSVESSGGPGLASARETNTADNLLLFDVENDTIEGDRNSTHIGRSNIGTSEQLSQLDACHNIKESEESGILRFVVKSQAYARRNRSRSGRDSTRMCSTDLASGGDGNRSSALPSFRHGSRDVKGSAFEASTQKGRTVTSICNSKSTSPNRNVIFKSVDRGLDVSQVHAAAAVLTRGEGESDVAAFKELQDKEHNQHLQVDAEQILDTKASTNPDLVGREHMVSSALGNYKKQIPVPEVTPDVAVVDVVKGDTENKAVEMLVDSNDDHNPDCSNPKNSGPCIKGEEDDNRSCLNNKVQPITNLESLEHNKCIVPNTEAKVDNVSSDSLNVKKAGLYPQGRAPTTTNSSNSELVVADFSRRGSVIASEPQTCTQSQTKLANKVHEDSILEEARSIEAKQKRIAELSDGSIPLVHRRKSHWDFVLEEVKWLANDFRQERLWKMDVAAQISRSVVLNVRSRVDKQSQCLNQRKVAHTLAKAVMEFWRSAGKVLSSDKPGVGSNYFELSLVGAQKVDEGEALDNRIRDKNMVLEKSQSREEESTRKSPYLAVQGYAVRFLRYSGSLDCPIQAEAPVTPDRISDSGIVDMSWSDQLSEETLFYTVPPGAMEIYRRSVEDLWSQYEKSGGNMCQEEVESFVYDAVAGTGFGSRENAFEEDEAEAGIYYLPGAFESSKSLKFAQKKLKNLQKSYSRSYEVGGDSPYGQFPENKPGTHSIILSKRPSNSLNVGSIPTKRVRTAPRQRGVNPYGAGAAGSIQMPNKTDASSGDTSSFQDDQSTAHGGSQMRRMDIESTGEFGRPLDYSEVSMKPKKKKKVKHSLYKNSMNSPDTGGFVGKGSSYEQRWQLDSMAPNGQRDYSKKRLDSHAFESNGNNGLFAQHALKRPKIVKQLQDNSPESIAPINGSIASPVASQNMPNPNKFMKIFAGRDRGRKTKAPKMPAGQSGSGSAWSLFEDQALVVLVHDMGPNWELISDAINSTLQFKCIYRKAKECKERHKILMDRNAGDGADSAEDSGSSQPYPSTLPGIPKGSARQLFQRLQGPMEEDTLKSHFEKIILLGQKQHSRRIQNDNQGLKQIAPVHGSHVAALHQVCPNNLNGVTLTPRELCEVTASSSDVLSLGYQGSISSGVALPNQGPMPPVLPTSGSSSVVQGSSPMALSNCLPSPCIAPNASTRDGQRYGVPRASSLPIDEHQKMPQYNQMLSGRSVQHPGLSTPGPLPTDRGSRMLPGGNSMGLTSGMNRGMPMPRPGYQGIGSPAMLNMVSSGSMLSSTGVGMPNSVNIHNGAIPAQGSSMTRTRDALHMMQSSDDQRQMMMQELRMQVTQGNSHCVPPYNGLSRGYPNQTVSPPVQAFPLQQQQQHPVPPQQSHALSNPQHPHLQGGTAEQQAYFLRLARERQVQQRMMQQQQQQQQQQHQFAASNASMPHPQPQPQSHHPTSSSLQSNSQMHQQASSQAVSLPSPNAQHSMSSSSSPMNPTSSHSQAKQHMPPHGLGRTPQAGGGNLSNQMLKQRQRQQQQLQQSGRLHPQPRQQTSQQQAKTVKGRANMIMHQNLPIDHSQVNGLAMAPGNQAAEKGEQVMHMMQGQGMFSGSGSTPIQSSKPLVPPQSSNQSQKLFSRSPSPSSKHLQQMPSHADSNHQGQVPTVSSGHPVVASQQPVLLQQQSQQKQAGHSQQGHRMLQQNRHVTGEPSVQSSADHVQVNQPINSTFQMATSTTMPQCSTDSTSSVVPVASGSAPSRWKSQEPLYDRGTPGSASHLASAGNPPLPSSSGGNDTVSSLPSQGSIQRQFSGSMPNHVHTPWQPKLQQQKQPPPQPPQQPASLQPQSQQMQQQQTGQGYDRPTNS